MKLRRLLNFPICLGEYKQFIDEIIDSKIERRSEYVCLANVHMLCEAKRDKKFLEVINNAGIVTPDGVPLIWGLRLLYGIRQKRIAGMDLFPDLLQTAVTNHLPVYFYGSDHETLHATEIYLEELFPDLIIAGMYSPPFRIQTKEEEIEIVDKINASGARLIFVVLGCPKQEKWMAGMKGKINGVMIGVGGALSVMIGKQSRAPKWMQQSGLEWLFRLACEPRRLFKRYAVTNSFFIYILLKEFIRNKIFGSHPQAA